MADTQPQTPVDPTQSTHSVQPVVVEQPVVTTGKLVFSFNHPTPLWAIWVFRTEFWLNKAIIGWLAFTHMLPAHQALETVGILAAIDGFVWGMAQSLGIKKEDVTGTT